MFSSELKKASFIRAPLLARAAMMAGVRLPAMARLLRQKMIPRR